jgi:hypothetical protein
MPVFASAAPGSVGTIDGVITDPSGAVIPNATVKIINPVSGYQSHVTTDDQGRFHFDNVPFNPYHLVVAAEGFNSAEQDVNIRSAVPLELKLALKLATSNTTVQVEANAEDLIESVPTAHTDVDQSLLKELPSESPGSTLSSVITLATPGVVADSNGLFHPLGEHADTTFSVDNQPISDQQSRVFSNQLSTNAIQPMEVVSGVPPAEFGDKASLVVRTTTKSGLGTTTPTGSVYLGYGSFGSATAGASVSFGSKRFGNFLTVDGLNSGRFLDSPEFSPIDDRGNNENIFDRIDFNRTQTTRTT